MVRNKLNEITFWAHYKRHLFDRVPEEGEGYARKDYKREEDREEAG